MYTTTHRVHRLTKDNHLTTDTTQAHILSSKRGEKNLIMLQVNINGIKNKLEELKMLVIHDTHAYSITIQETSSLLKQKLPKYITSPPCPPIDCSRRGWAHHTHQRQHYIHYNRQTFDHQYTKHITIANIYIPPRDSTSTHYKQLTCTYSTAYSTSQTYHTRYSLEM